MTPNTSSSTSEAPDSHPDRRDFLKTSATAAAGSGLAISLPFTASTAAPQPETLPGTDPLTREGDLSMQLIEQVDAHFLERLNSSPQRRARYWDRDYSSPAAYRESIAPNRERFRTIIGLKDERLPSDEMEIVSTRETPGLVAEGSGVEIRAVRWPVFERMHGEGLLLEPSGMPRAQTVVLPDADQVPELFAGIGDPEDRQAVALRLAQAGVRVLVPTILNRDNTWSGNPIIRMTNQTHREFIHRQAWYMGRHVIGYEVQKLLGGVDYFEKQADDLPVGVFGYGEGGLLALYGAAVDDRIDVTVVSGYFAPRERIWEEPLYRNVWGLLKQFGDAEIASMVVPRDLIVEAAQGPETDGRPPERNGLQDAAHGRLWSPALSDVQREAQRARAHFEALGAGDRLQLIESGGGQGPFGSTRALRAFADALGIEEGSVPATAGGLTDRRGNFDPDLRMKRQYDEMVDQTQHLVEVSPYEREKFWGRRDENSPLRRSAMHRYESWQEMDFYALEDWEELTPEYREVFHEDLVGQMPDPSEPPNPRTRLIYETPDMKGYEVLLDVWEGVTAYGIILIPTDIRPGEQRPVVVTQHGRGGRPQDVTNPTDIGGAYHAFGARLAEDGFVVYAPQNLYLGEAKYRLLDRKTTPLKNTFFGPMVGQHRQVLNWLRSLDYVDDERIGFYGLSYGGRSAMFIPALLEDYAVSICSGDFTQSVWKHASVHSAYSFLFTKEYEHTLWDAGDRFSYANIAGLICPRPFMVERGHYDGVSPDEWVNYEYGAVRRLYADLRIPEWTEIEHFIGVHEIYAQGTFDFLKKHLGPI